MSNIDWGALAAKIAADLRNNAPLAVPTARPDLATILPIIEADAEAFSIALNAHPGVLSAVADFLEALSSAGVTWANGARDAILELPSALASAESWEPTILWALTAFAPVGAGIEGEPPDGGLRVGRG